MTSQSTSSALSCLLLCNYPLLRGCTLSTSDASGKGRICSYGEIKKR